MGYGLRRGALLARIFLSHSSANNAEAVSLRDWLTGEGWDDLFLDLDPTRGIAAGERWELALKEAANRCEAVLFLVSRAWLSSRWCLEELSLAGRLNKRIFGVLIEDLPIADLPAALTATHQLVSLAAGSDHVMLSGRAPDGEVRVTFSRAGLAKLKTGLLRAGLGPRFFLWPPKDDPDRPPYRGLKALEAEDAGIFFGREAPTIEALDRLRGLAQAAAPRLMAIIGASGAGKSSFLRAGLAPRLARDDRAFLMLPIVRPERAVLHGDSGLVRALEAAAKTLGLPKARAEIKAVVESGATAVAALLDAFARKATVPDSGDNSAGQPPRVALAIDQGEELFLADGQGEASAFLAVIRDLIVAPESNLIVIFAIRSDSFERLQTAPALDGLNPQAFSLPPMPRGAYQTVIEGPAKRLAEIDRVLTIEPALGEALLADIEEGGGKDALPLLAFTLERLYLEYGGGGALTLAQYRALGGIRGSIEAAVEGALNASDNDPAVPKDPAARLALLRRALIPWLAGIDTETNAPRRRVARLSEIPPEARPLIDHLVEARLLSTDVSAESNERTVEPAHEALLRQWGLLQDWLEEDFAALATLEGVQRAARDWAANARDEAWLAHAAGRLEDAEAVAHRDDFAGMLEPSDRAYLDAAHAAETARRDRDLEEARKLAAAQREAAEAAKLAAEKQRQVARRTRLGLIAASVLAAVAVTVAAWGWTERQAAVQQAVAAEKAVEDATAERDKAKQANTAATRNETISFDALSRAALAEGRPVDAVKLALAAWPRAGDGERPALKRTVSALAPSLARLRQRLLLRGHTDEVFAASFSSDGSRVLTASRDKTARVWDAANGTQIMEIGGHADAVLSAAFSPDGTRIVTASADTTAREWDAKTGAQLLEISGHGEAVLCAVFSPDGSRILTSSADGTARVWDASTGKEMLVLTNAVAPDAPDAVTSAAYSRDGSSIVTSYYDGSARVWNATTGDRILILKGNGFSLASASFSPDGARIATASTDGTVGLWDVRSGSQVATLKGHSDWVWSARFSPDGNRIVTASKDGTVRVWDVASAKQNLTLAEHDGAVHAAGFSPDGTQVVTAAENGLVRIWQVAEPFASVNLARANGNVLGAAFSPDGLRVATSSWNGTTSLWNARTGALLTELTGVDGYVDQISFSPNGAWFAVASDQARLCNSSAWSHCVQLNRPIRRSLVGSVAFSPDSTLLATADDLVVLWSVPTGRQVLALKAPESYVRAMAFSPDGRRIATASNDHIGRVLDVQIGALLATLSGHRDIVTSIAFSPDGARLATSSNDGTARLWDANSGSQLAVLKLDQYVHSIAFSPDGKLVLTVSTEGGGRLWNAETGTLLWALDGHTGSTVSAKFSPDGMRVVTASDDKTARVWDTATGAMLAVLSGHSEAVNSAAFSPDGTRIVTASSDDTARIWDISTLEKGDAFLVACRKLGNDTDLADIEARYGLAHLTPVCGDHLPIPVAWSKLR